MVDRSSQVGWCVGFDKMVMLRSFSDRARDQEGRSTSHCRVDGFAVGDLMGSQDGKARTDQLGYALRYGDDSG